MRATKCPGFCGIKSYLMIRILGKKVIYLSDTNRGNYATGRRCTFVLERPTVRV